MNFRAAAENVNCQNKAEICHQQQNKHELQEKKIRMLQEVRGKNGLQNSQGQI